MSPDPKQVREMIARWQWAERMAHEEYGDDSMLSDEQRERYAAKKENRIRWLMSGPGPGPRPVLSEEARQASLRDIHEEQAKRLKRLGLPLPGTPLDTEPDAPTMST